MPWSDRIASARQDLIAAADKPAPTIPFAHADALDIEHRIAHMGAIASAYLALMLTLLGDLNDNMPSADKVRTDDFRNLVSDAFGDASGAFRRVADRAAADRPMRRRAS
jgi:hypothetical protein